MRVLQSTAVFWSIAYLHLMLEFSSFGFGKTWWQAHPSGAPSYRGTMVYFIMGLVIAIRKPFFETMKTLFFLNANLTSPFTSLDFRPFLAIAAFSREVFWSFFTRIEHFIQCRFFRWIDFEFFFEKRSKKFFIFVDVFKINIRIFNFQTIYFVIYFVSKIFEIIIE